MAEVTGVANREAAGPLAPSSTLAQPTKVNSVSGQRGLDANIAVEGTLRHFMKIDQIAVLLVSLVCLALSSAASASVFTATYTGTITDGDGYIDLFGAASSSLIGQTVKTVYTYDTSLGNLNAVNSGGSNYNQILGGSQINKSTPMLSAVLTINGFALDFTGSVFGEVLAEQDASFDVFLHSAYSDISDNGNAATGIYSEITPALSTDVNTAFNWDPSKGGQGYGGLFSYGYTGIGRADYDLGFAYNSLEVALVPANGVPEPDCLYLVCAAFVALWYVRLKTQPCT